MTDQLRSFYNTARAIFPSLPHWYEEVDGGVTMSFEELNAGGLPVFQVPAGFDIAENQRLHAIVWHETGHAYRDLVIARRLGTVDPEAIRQSRPELLARFRAFASIPPDVDVDESWAEVFANAVAGAVVTSKSAADELVDPLAARAFFQSLTGGSTLRTMYDSTNANDIPLTAEMVAGYVDGLYIWSDADWARFPNAVKVRISVFGNDADVLDVESGAATPGMAPDWANRQRARGAEPIVYVNLSNVGAVRAAFEGTGEPQPLYWLASYDNNPTIPAGYIAKQYANEPLSGGHFDLSVVADTWPEGGDMVSKDEFEAYKVALEQQLIAQYASITHTHPAPAPAKHSHPATTTVAQNP